MSFQVSLKASPIQVASRTQSMSAVQASMEYCPYGIYLPFCTDVSKSVISNSSIITILKKKNCILQKHYHKTPLNPKLFAQHQFYIRLAIPKKDALQNCCQFSARLHSSCTTQHRLLNLFVKSQKASLLSEKAFSCSLMCPAFDRSSHCSQRIQHKQIQTNKIHNSQVTANLPNRLKCQLLPTQSLQAH